jgi:RecA/RadA recombinase
MARKTKSKKTDSVSGGSSKNQAPPRRVIDAGLPSPSTLLNLACSDNYKTAFSRGRMVNIVGDSSAGKSMLALGCLKEALISSSHDNYRLIYDDAEHALDMNLTLLFGQDLADAIEPPAEDDVGDPIYSDSIEDFHYYLSLALDDTRPFIYILDSFDAVTADADEKKMQELFKARAGGKETKGTYGMAKAKKASEILRSVCSRLHNADSYLIIISQTRDNVGWGFEKKTRSGGRALRFYAHHEIWLNHKSKIKTTAKGTARVIGNLVESKLKKNKITGKLRDVTFPIYYDIGVDDAESMIEFLIAEKIWKRTGASINAADFDAKGNMNTVIESIYENNQYEELQQLVQEVWLDIEEAVRVKRPGKYQQ